IFILILPPEAFSIEAAQASAAGCIGCDAGTQCAKRHSTVLSWANAGPAQSNAAASAVSLRCFMTSPSRLLCSGGIDQRPNVADGLDLPELCDQSLCACRTQHRLDIVDELLLEPGIVERHETRAERLVGLAHEFSARCRHGHARRAQFWIKRVDLGRRRDGELPGKLAECRIGPRLCVEMMHLDAAEACGKSHQIREGELRAGVIVPAGMRVLGRDAVGLDIDMPDLAGVDLL